ncbi:MAG TPA: UDP-2,3-diacylglucosamine diphosphatase [Bordetella sp.]
MNRLVLPEGPVWLASDLHLSESTPATQEAFLGFLQAAAGEAAALLLPGDIFNTWIGDDVITDPEPWLAQALDGLKTAAARLPVYLGRGNRDFLMGRRLARALGAHLLPDSVLAKTAYGDVLLSHGDEYCTDDEAYQRWRRKSRNPIVQRIFLLRSLASRQDFARRAREKSMAAKRDTPPAIMDVNPQAVEKAFRESGARLMVHGHTHRPARHVLTVDGRQCERWVLPDWDLDHAEPPRGGWLVIDADGPQFYDLESA